VEKSEYPKKPEKIPAKIVENNTSEKYAKVCEREIHANKKSRKERG